MQRFEKLLDHVQQMPADRIYRTIYDEEHNPVVHGHEIVAPWELADFHKVDFQGKTVIDVGCNFGWFCMQARRAGAAHVLGVDHDELALVGARLLQASFGLDGLDFEPLNLEARPSPLLGRTFDIAMLLDFIGRSYLVQGLVPALLDLFETLSVRELLLSIRPVYLVREDMDTSEEHLAGFYPGRFIRDGSFYLLEYVRERFAPRWDMEALSDLETGYRKYKRYIRFYR
jgi:tRNA (mo5U34)-methyltransferase